MLPAYVLSQYKQITEEQLTQRTVNHLTTLVAQLTPCIYMFPIDMSTGNQKPFPDTASMTTHQNQYILQTQSSQPMQSHHTLQHPYQ
jgi:hypothetical protein